MRSAAFLLIALTGCITDPGLFVRKSGDGEGRVVSDPAGIDCGEKCGGLLTGPTTLVATPDATSRFVGWQGAMCEAAGTEPCVLDVDEDIEFEVEAVFERLPMTLTIETPVHGKVTGPGGLDCGATCSVTYAFGSEVRITAVPDPGYALQRWSDNSQLAARTFTMNKDVTLAVEFVSTARLGVTFTGNGVVTSAPAGINCGATAYPAGCSATFEPNTMVTLTGTPSIPEQRVVWTGCTPTGSNTCVVAVNGVTYVTATFTY